MENFDNLIISLLDSDAMKGCFKNELAKLLNIDVECVTDVWLQTNLVNNVASQELYVSFVDAKIPKSNLMKLPFKYIYENCVVFEIGDSII